MEPKLTDIRDAINKIAQTSEATLDSVWNLYEVLTKFVGEYAKTHGGYLPGPVFHSIGTVFGQNPIELVPVRCNPETGSMEILYIERPPEDPEFQGLHNPGTIQRTWMGAHETIDEAQQRLVREELGEGVIVRVLHEFPRFEHVVPPRGFQSAIVRIAEVQGTVKEGEWHPYDTLPATLLPTQREYMGLAQAWLKEHPLSL
jgi:hypothetical protein